MKKIITIITLLILTLGLVGCGADKVEETPVEVEETPVEVVEAPVVEEVIEAPVVLEGEGDVTEEAADEMMDAGLAADVTLDAQEFDEATCKKVDGKNVISVKVTNSGEEALEIYAKGHPKGKVRITVNAVVNIEPGCGVEELAAGESVVCENIFNGVQSGENRVNIATPMGTEAKIVMCP